LHASAAAGNKVAAEDAAVQTKQKSAKTQKRTKKKTVMLRWLRKKLKLVTYLTSKVLVRILARMMDSLRKDDSCP
jgi:hypothetical protein